MHQAHATSSLLSGNNFFSVRNYKGAVSSYTDGINILLSSKETSKDSNTNNKSFTMQQQQLLAVLYSNRSGANLLLANGNQALEDANNALGLNDQRSKFYGRKGSAHHFLGQYQDAIDSYEKGLDLVNGSEHIGLKEGLKAVKLAKQQSRMLGGGMTEGPSQLAGHKRPRSPPSSSHQSTVVGDSNTTTSTSSAASSSLSSSISATKTTVNVLDDFVADVSIIGATVKKLERAVDDSKLGSPNEELSRILQKNHKW
jgi:tetratricopeptide (TPR) repeat protein